LIRNCNGNTKRSKEGDEGDTADQMEGDRRGMTVALPTMYTWGVGAHGLQGDGVAPVTGDPRSAGHACSGS